MSYAELHVTSNFSFLRGASHAEELVLTAAALGHKAIAITDHNTVAGIVRAHEAAKEAGLRLIIGARLDFDDAPSLLCLPSDRAAYGRLTSLLTIGRRRASKGECRLVRADLDAHCEGQIVVVLPPERPDAAFVAKLRDLQKLFPRFYLAAHHLYRGDDARRLQTLADIADTHAIKLVATNDVHYHVPERRALQDVVTCIRERCTLRAAGYRLFANAERHLKSPAEMARLFASRPEALAHTLEIADSCHFSLEELRYEYPAEPVPDGRTPQEELERLTWAGAQTRYANGIPDKARELLQHELKLIAGLKYAPYFLTVHDLMRFAHEQGILCQGRGSAANSIICYCLGITAVEPTKTGLLFERFVSAERNEPPDIDVDFEHERREEVIQYIYQKYGRDRAALAATVIRYRPRSAVRDVGKVLGLSADTIDVLAKSVWGWERSDITTDDISATGLDPKERTVRTALQLAHQLMGFPRHLSQHVGGFVITKGPLHELVPIENAAMEDRTVIEWDKDDLDAVGLLKVDVLALGMLTCIRKGFGLLAAHHAKHFKGIGDVPDEDPRVYEMLSRADSIGVFQVESRAQMSMLPRLKPKTFYDLVIEVAIVRPGPIQGDMVHPYLRRREGKEKVTYPSKALEEVLGKTMGVPLFQEQAMRIAIVAAGFTPGEADRLRRAMATFRHVGTIHTFQTKLIEGMVKNGYPREFAERCFEQIRGFGEYGFPESHAASFALLVYVSAWIKCHYPAAFAASLLNSQPMGFYAPAQIVRDAREHGVEVRAVDVNHSDWDCTLEPGRAGQIALRLGFREVKGLREVDMQRLVERRATGYATLREVWQRAQILSPALETLANADAWNSLGLTRREALWQIRALGADPLPLFAAAPIGHNQPADVETAHEQAVVLPDMTLGEHVIEDYRHLTLSLKKHPLALVREGLTADGVVAASRLAHIENDKVVRVAGLVLVRQQPGTASGVVFVTLEDETGVANVIVWPSIFRRFRRVLLDSRLLLVSGKLQKTENNLVIHVIADTLSDRTDALRRLAETEGAFEGSIARADEVRKPGHDVRNVLPRGRNFQ